jgi:hypothetical protein
MVVNVRVKYWEIIADNLSKAGWSWGCVSVIGAEVVGIQTIRESRNAKKKPMTYYTAEK